MEGVARAQVGFFVDACVARFLDGGASSGPGFDNETQDVESQEEVEEDVGGGSWVGEAAQGAGGDGRPDNGNDVVGKDGSRGPDLVLVFKVVEDGREDLLEYDEVAM